MVRIPKFARLQNPKDKPKATAKKTPKSKPKASNTDAFPLRSALRVFYEVKFADKDKAYQLGAVWDGDLKSWFSHVGEVKEKLSAVFTVNQELTDSQRSDEMSLRSAVSYGVKSYLKGTSMEWSVKRACKWSGYPTLSHVEKGMRALIPADVLESRALFALRGQPKSKRKPIGPDDPAFGRALHMAARDKQRDHKHFQSI
jgi:hypothetical protein